MDILKLDQLVAALLNSGQIKASLHKRLSVIYSFFYDGHSRISTSRLHGVSLPFVDRWRDRWRVSQVMCEDWFGDDNKEKRGRKADRDFILSLIEDAPRSGAPAIYGPEVKAQIIAIALRKPSDEGVPVERWSHDLLARHVVEKGIVAQMSSTRIGDFLKSAPRKSSSE